jgi:hypothetical protein
MKFVDFIFILVTSFTVAFTILWVASVVRGHPMFHELPGWLTGGTAVIIATILVVAAVLPASQPAPSLAALKRHDVNVVRQDRERVADDGSLAVYCQRQGVRYVNVEAGYGRPRRQP